MEQRNPSFQTLNIPMNVNALNAYKKAFNYAMDNNSKLLIIREDIHFPKEMSDEMAQDLIKPFNRKLREKWKNDGYKPVYIAAREVSSKGRIHYHEVWFLNGQKTWKTFERHKESEQLLQRVIGPEYDAKGLIDHCDNGHRNGIMINCNNPDPTDLEEAQLQVSYLAKTSQKKDVKGKTYFTSIIPKKN